MYATALSPSHRRQRRGGNGAAVAGMGESDTTADPGPAARTAADYWRDRGILPHLANRRDAAPRGTFRRRSDRQPAAGSGATLLPERDHVTTDLPPVVRSPGGWLGIRNPPAPSPRRG